MAPQTAYIPFLINNPVGWMALGVAGYLTYKAGKTVGLKSNENADCENLADRMVKGTIKTAYKAKIKIGASLSKTREKYSAMWDEVQAEIRASS